MIFIKTMTSKEKKSWGQLLTFGKYNMLSQRQPHTLNTWWHFIFLKVLEFISVIPPILHGYGTLYWIYGTLKNSIYWRHAVKVKSFLIFPEMSMPLSVVFLSTLFLFILKLKKCMLFLKFKFRCLGIKPAFLYYSW